MSANYPEFWNEPYPEFTPLDMGGDGHPEHPYAQVGEYEVVHDFSQSESLHDFQISVVKDGATWDISVRGGTVWVPTLDDDSNGDALAGLIPNTVTATTAAAPFINIADNTNTGIWLEVNIGSPAASWPPINAGANDPGELQQDPVTTINLTAFTNPGVGPYHETSHLSALTASTAAKSYIYIGKVNITSGVVTITQSAKGPVTWPGLHYLVALISGESGNDLVYKSADNGMWVRVVSSDAANAITQDTDNSALLKLVEGDGITITESPAGTHTFTNDGVLSVKDGTHGVTFAANGAADGSTGHLLFN